jgi:hypothetical protein
MTAADASDDTAQTTRVASACSARSGALMDAPMGVVPQRSSSAEMTGPPPLPPADCAAASARACEARTRGRRGGAAARGGRV